MIKEKLYKTWLWLKSKWKTVIAVLGIGSALAYGGTQPITPNEIAWVDFTNNLEFIEYQHKGKPIRDLKNLKGIWIPTEEEFKEVYKYAYGFDMVNWQLPDGTPMCGIGREATNCVPHWKQEFENNKFRGQEQGDILKGLRDVRKNEVNSDVYSIQPISKKNSWNEKIVRFLQNLIQSVYAGVEFQDEFTVVSDTQLRAHTPTTAGTGYTNLITVGTCILYVDSGANTFDGTDSILSGGCGGNEGSLDEGDDVMSHADVIVQMDQVNGDTADDKSDLCCRIQDSTHLICVTWNESADSRLWENAGAGWVQRDQHVGGGVADGSTIELICEGSAISVEDDGSEILSFTTTLSLVAGKIGIGIGEIGTGLNYDAGTMEHDNLVANVTGAAPPAAAPAINRSQIIEEF